MHTVIQEPLHLLHYLTFSTRGSPEPQGTGAQETIAGCQASAAILTRTVEAGGDIAVSDVTASYGTSYNVNHLIRKLEVKV